MSFFLYGCVAIVLLNAFIGAAARIVRAGSFGKGNVVGATPADMQFFRNGVASGAYVLNHAWSDGPSRKAAFLRRWFLLFPRKALTTLASFRYWLWCALQGAVLFVFCLLWPEMRI